MIPFTDWVPLVCIGATFTTFGLFKLYGFRHHVVGGGGKPFGTRLRGSCPTWSKHVNVTIMVAFLAIGLSSLIILGWLIVKASWR